MRAKSLKMSLNQMPINNDFIAQNANFRELKNTKISSHFIYYDNKKLINLASNDYLGIASSKALRDEFLASLGDELFFGSGASRLVYSASDEYNALESDFEARFKGKKALIFNSGYAANLATISALNDENTLFLADKLVHASMIDALKSTAPTPPSAFERVISIKSLVMPCLSHSPSSFKAKKLCASSTYKSAP